MAHGRPVVGRGPTPQAINSTMKRELRLAQKFKPSQSSSSATRPVATHSPLPQQQLSPTNRVPGDKSSSYFPTYPIEPPQSKGDDDDSPTCAHPIMIVVEEVAVPIKDGEKIKENRQEEHFGGSAAKGGKEDKMQKGTVIIIVTKENADTCGEDNEIHTKNPSDYVGGEFSKSNKDEHVTCVLQQLSLAPQQRDKTKTVPWPYMVYQWCEGG
jgi:hypothetical protein